MCLVNVVRSHALVCLFKMFFSFTTEYSQDNWLLVQSGLEERHCAVWLYCERQGQWGDLLKRVILPLSGHLRLCRVSVGFVVLCLNVHRYGFVLQRVQPWRCCKGASKRHTDH